MGCVSSKHDINDQHPNIFQVTNVNEQGELMSPGQLEITETELVLHQRNKPQVIWPLKALRKYGFDAGIFSFESGRRCPTGEGIYAFHCQKSEQLFNMVQQNIARNSTNEETGGNNPIGVLSQNSEFPMPAISTGPPVQRRVQSQPPDGYLNPVPTASVTANPRPHPSLSRPGSLTSNGGPLSPTTTGTFAPVITEIPTEHNNNKRGSLVPEHNYTNSAVLEVENQQPPPIQANYVNLGLNSPPPAVAPLAASEYMNIGDSPNHLYMNVDTKNATKETQVTDAEEDFRHCYANVDAKDMEAMRQVDGVPCLINNGGSSVPQTPTALYLTVHEVNYAELDLDPSKVASSISQVTPDSPSNKAKSYATIDFERTNALSQSINPRMEIEDGSRKTRHNSTISDVTVRQSSSLSD